MTEFKFPMSYNYSFAVEASFVSVRINGHDVCFGLACEPMNVQAARLISAAPDMYREIVNDIELLEREAEQHAIGSPRYNAIYDMIYRKRELISKANGENQ